MPAGLPARAPGAHHRRVEHFGYLGAVRDTKDKSNRNLELLERQVAEGVDNPFLHFNLGSEYAAAGDVTARADALRARLDHRSRRRAREQRRLCAGAGLALRPRAAQRRPPGRRRRRGRRGLEVFPGFTDIVLEQALAAGAAGDAERQEALLRRCLEMGDGPSRYSATVGCGTYRPLVALAEVLRRRGAVEEAEETLRGCLREHPGFLAAVDPYAALLLRRGVPAAEVVETVHALVADSSPSMRFLLAVSLSEAGAVAEAESRAARGASRPSRPTPTPASRWPRRFWPRAASRTPRPRPPRSTPRRPAPPPPSAPSSSPC